jgi:hypothetical protein
VGGDVVRPHLLTTAIGHGAIAADGIDRFLQANHWKSAQDRRPQLRPEAQDGRKGLSFTQMQEPMRHRQQHGAIHNFDNRSDRYVISHKELFLGHFNYTPRNQRTSSR